MVAQKSITHRIMQTLTNIPAALDNQLVLTFQKSRIEKTVSFGKLSVFKFENNDETNLDDVLSGVKIRSSLFGANGT